MLPPTIADIIEVVMAGAKDRVRSVSVHKAVNFQCGRPAVKSHSLWRASDYRDHWAPRQAH